MRFLLLALIFSGPYALAQSTLQAHPNPLDGSVADTLELRPASTVPVSVDSLQFESLESGFGPTGWFFSFSVHSGNNEQPGNDRQVGLIECYPRGFSPEGHPCVVQSGQGEQPFGTTLAPSDTLLLYGFELGCFRCAVPTRSSQDDVLFIYSGGEPEPLRVPILNIRFVNTENPPRPTNFHVVSYPNPTRDRVSLDITVSSLTDVQIEVLNVTGQRVAGPIKRVLAAGTHAIVIPLARASAGTYYLAIRSTDGTTVERIHRAIVLLR